MPVRAVRLKPDTHASLLRIAQEDGKTMSEIVAMLVDRYKRERFWRGVQEDLAELEADPVAWRGYQDELRIWDQATIMDGLNDEEPYYVE